MKIPSIVSLAVLLSISAQARDFTDCGNVEMVVLKQETGKLLGAWSIPGLGVSVSPFLLAPNGKSVYAGISTCQDSKGVTVNRGVLPEGGRLVQSAISLSIPKLDSLSPQLPTPGWTKNLEPLPSSQADALTWWYRMLFYDKTQSPPVLKLIDLQYRPVVHILPELWTGTVVREFFIGQNHAFVFLDERTLICFDSNGKLLWRWSHDGPKDEAGPGVKIDLYEVGELLLVAVNHAGLYAINPTTGKVIWRFKYFNIYNPAPIIQAGNDVLVLGPVSRGLFN